MNGKEILPNRTVICVVGIRNNNILLVRKQETWILPGGKPETEESDIQCLIREIKEELPGIKLKNFQFYKMFKGVTPHKGDLFQTKAYFADIEGELNPSAEINAAEWVENTSKYKLSDITKKVIYSLHREGLLYTPIYTSEVS